MKELILEKNLLSAVSVEDALLESPLGKVTREHIQEKNLTIAKSVKNLLIGKTTSMSI